MALSVSLDREGSFSAIQNLKYQFTALQNFSLPKINNVRKIELYNS